jgi:surfactin synthase thioesterase subunit
MDLGYHADVPFSLLGHCWGSYVALETAMVLKKVYNVSPAKLFVLSLVPPEVSDRTAFLDFTPFGDLPREAAPQVQRSDRAFVSISDR